MWLIDVAFSNAILMDFKYVAHKRFVFSICLIINKCYFALL